MPAGTVIEFEPLSAILGARVHGVDLTEPDSPARSLMLREAFSKYCVLCFPQQTISNEDQIRFARNFGRADADFMGKPTANDTPEYDGPAKRGVMYISNLRENGQQVGALPDGELHFHSDGAHRKSPYRATSLFAIEIPSVGGETKFANMQMAYDHLPEAMKRRLDGLMVNNVYDTRATLREQTDETDETLSNARHPLVRVHPDSGRQSLYLSRLMTRNIVGMDRAESDALLEELFAHIERPEFIYAHSWKVADLLIWDNRAVNHARADFPASERRHLRRVTVSEP
jgi:taurine dioxygenase